MRVFMDQGLCALWIDSVDVEEQNCALSVTISSVDRKTAIEGLSEGLELTCMNR